MLVITIQNMFEITIHSYLLNGNLLNPQGFKAVVSRERQLPS